MAEAEYTAKADPRVHPSAEQQALDRDTTGPALAVLAWTMSAACLLAVTDTFGPDGERHRMDKEAIAARGEDLGRVGAAALLALDARARA